MDNNNMNNEQNNFYQDNTANVNAQAPVYNTVAAEKKTDVMAIISLVCGIISIILPCCLSFIAYVPAIAGLILAIVSQKKNGKSGLATAGLICSIIGIVLTTLITVLGLIGIAADLV